MNWNDYRKAVENLPLSADFRERTEELVTRRMREIEEKERNTMNKRAFPRIAAIAAVIALLTVSAYAASRILDAGQVADLADYPILAQAFDSNGGTVLGESVETGDFRVTLTGLVSGAGLTDWSADLDETRTYAVVALERLDGMPLDTQTFPFIDYTFTPLVAGFNPWTVNNWTLDAGVRGLSQDGVYYYLLDTQNLEMFADHTVYLAFYEGSVPSRESFTIAEDGSIAFAEDFEGPHALFTLPLDSGKADPAAVEEFIDGSGFDREWFVYTAPAEDDLTAQGPESSGSILSALQPEDGANIG